MRFTLFLFTLLALSCSKTDDISSPCMSGDCDARLILDYPQDTNGYYHVDLNFNAEYYPRFNIFVEDSLIDLIEKMTDLNFKTRLNINQILRHKYFS